MHRHLIDLANEAKLPLRWCAILTTPYYRPIMGEVLSTSEILDVFRTLPRVPLGGDPACVSHYPGSLVEDLAAQKRSRRKRNGQWLLNRGIDYYRLYKNFLIEQGATHILMSSIETPDAKIAVAIANELGLGVMAPMGLRNMTGTYFSTDCYETPPDHAVATSESRAHAIAFIDAFRNNPTPAYALPMKLASNAEDATLPAYLPPLWQRIKRLTAMVIERPDIFDFDQLRVSVMANAPLLHEIVRGTREQRNATQFDIAEIEALPQRFIYYPLQYSPEASINTPAPYFVDQTRAVDALRFAMPSDHLLVVKEHPACVEMRPPNFMRRLRCLPGVVVIKASVPSLELIRRAALTVTVTGTAAFEAFLLGRPALALGRGLSAWAIGRTATLANLRIQILGAINKPMSSDFVIDQIARLMSIRYPFFFDPPHLLGEPMLRVRNMKGFLSALVDHLERERSLARTLDPSNA